MFKPIGFGLQIKTTARHFLVGSSSVVLYENDLENKVIVSYVARCSQKILGKHQEKSSGCYPLVI